MIPPFNSRGRLPPGIHEATWGEFVERFGYSARREELMQGLLAAMLALRAAGCPRIYINGSFVRLKKTPGDFDACWDVEGIDENLLDPVLVDFDDGRAAQKAKYGGELFPAPWLADWDGATFLEFFQREKKGNRRKGIVAIDLRGFKP